MGTKYPSKRARSVNLNHGLLFLHFQAKKALIYFGIHSKTLIKKPAQTNSRKYSDTHTIDFDFQIFMPQRLTVTFELDSMRHFK